MSTATTPLLCELHAHSTWSDGQLTVRQLADLYGSAGFDVLCVTDHVNREDDPWLTPRERRLFGVQPHNHAAYLAELDAEAERALALYGLLLLAGAELSYNDTDPLHAAHAVAVGLRTHVPVDRGIAEAMRAARAHGAAIVAAHPCRPGTGPLQPRTTQGLAQRWQALAPLLDRWELYNRHEAFAWIAETGLPAVASGDFHRPEHLWGWKTVLPCAKRAEDVIGCLKASGPVHLARIEQRAGDRAAA